MWLVRVPVVLGTALLLAFGASTLLDVAVPPQQLTAEAAQKVCSTSGTGGVLPLPQTVMPSGVTGTSTADLQGFANRYNEIRIANCLAPVPTDNFRHNTCIEQRLIWIAEDPSDDPLSAWGHDGTQRSDGKPPVGCDANLAGGPTTTGMRAAEKWWFSNAHRDSLYRPGYGGPIDSVCVDFAMTHGGVPDEPQTFTRAGAVWTPCDAYRDRVERLPY